MKKILSLVVLGLIWGYETKAGDLYVPSGTYTTIQSAIDAAVNGDTIYVGSGTYNEAIYINKRISIIGAGANVCTITAISLGNTNTVTFDGENANGTITGFTVTGEMTITDFPLTRASRGGFYNTGNGIYCLNGANPTIINNTISGHTVCGISCYYSSPIIINNTISENGDVSLFCYNSSPIITNNTISGNNWVGIYCDNESSPTITNNTISENGEVGISCYSSSSPHIVNNIISKNNWNGIFCSSSSPQIINNTISRNTFYGISCRFSSPVITNNIITENGRTSDEYFGILSDNSSPQINYNCVWGNGQSGNNSYSGCSAGPNDISYNPQFISNGNFHLQPLSPCIDAGSNTAIGTITTDKDGNPRFVNGIIDIGAYEYQSMQQEGIISSLGTLSYSTQTTFAETINKKILMLENTTEDISFEDFEEIMIKTGRFANNGFFKSKLILGESSYLINGSLYQKEGKIHLNGVLEGGFGIIEAVLGSQTYYGTVTCLEIENQSIISQEAGFGGNITSMEEEEYPATKMHYRQIDADLGTISLVATMVKIDDPNNPYNDEGFAIISYSSAYGFGEGYTYVQDRRLEGIFKQPLYGLILGSINESEGLLVSIIQVDYGLPAKSDVDVEIWGPGRVSPGQIITYMINLRNSGLVSAKDISIIASPPTFTDYISASDNHTYFTIAHWEDIEHWQTSNVIQVPRIRWDFSEIPAMSVTTLNFQVKVKWGLPEGLSESPEVYIWPKAEADDFYPTYDPEGGHDFDGEEE
ncbi:MAG: right-handed parallel beta-helix repeat-containing protein [bacterium]